MDTSQIRLFLSGFLSGRYTAQEHTRFMTWLDTATADEVAAIAAEFQEMIKQRHTENEEADIDLILKIEARIDEYERQQLAPIAEKKINWKKWLQLAAAFAGLLIVSGTLYYFLYNKGNAKAPANAAITYLEKKVPFGTIGSVILQDGTTVSLNAGSRLVYPRQFSGPAREVFLQGEACFEVAADPAKPFIVHAGSLSTRVLGTTFNMNVYKGSSRMEVTVLNGKVAVKDTLSGQEVTLASRQRARLDTKENKLTVARVDHPENVLAWQKGKLVFEESSLRDVVEALSRRYGTPVVLGNERLAGCHITVDFEKETLADVMKIITALTGTKYREQKDTITLYGKGCGGY